MFDEAKPWHKPDFKIGLDATCKLGSKFTIGAGINIIGNRWVRNYYACLRVWKRSNRFCDVNINLNYNYSKVFTLFADLYNIAERSYMIWNQYPSQRFNFLFGFSYKL